MFFILSTPVFADSQDIGYGVTHGNYYANLGVGYDYWTVNKGRALVLPINSQYVWGNDVFFVSSSWRLLWGAPDYFNISYGYETHYYPFGQYLGFGCGAYVGTFVFLTWTGLLQPSVSIDIPVESNNFISVSPKYNLEGLVIPLAKTVGWVDGFEVSLSILQKY